MKTKNTFCFQSFQIYINEKVKITILSYSMTIQEFDNHSQLKFMIPFIYVMSWLAMIFGPFYFPILYNHYCMAILLYLGLRSLILCGLNIKLVQNYHQMMKSSTSQEEKQLFIRQRSFIEIYHAFIIPSYNEDVELLAQTLSALAKHQRAKSSYLIFLAMQKHEVKSQEKAMKLLKMFQQKFMYLTYTLHEISGNEHKGKASNVNYCALTMQKTFQQLLIEETNVFLTIIDSDSIAPQLYIDEVDKHILKNLNNCHKYIYQPPQIYARNNFQVNALIRSYDDMYSSMHGSSLISLSGISFSLSNYTLSYSLAKNVGFWDTNQEAIGQDMHMCIKAIFKTEGQVETVPIYTPFNQLNIQTGHGAIKDIKAKFWQVQRHARGVADVSYSINMLIRSNINFKSFWTTVSIVETFFLPIVTPWVIISAFCQNHFIGHLLNREILTFSPEDLCFVITLTNIVSFISNLVYEVFKRRSAKQLHNVQNPSLWRIFEGSLLFSTNIIFFTIPAFVCGTFGNLMANRQYKVTEKNTMKLRKQDLLNIL